MTIATEGSARQAVRVHRETSGDGARGAHEEQVGAVIQLVALAETCRRAPAAAPALITKDERLSQGHSSAEGE